MLVLSQNDARTRCEERKDEKKKRSSFGLFKLFSRALAPRNSNVYEPKAAIKAHSKMVGSAPLNGREEKAECGPPPRRGTLDKENYRLIT